MQAKAKEIKEILASMFKKSIVEQINQLKEKFLRRERIHTNVIKGTIKCLNKP